jgi:Tfp pilus assembly protein PilN
VNDLDEAAYLAAVAALQIQRAALAHYGQIVEAQRGALRVGDLVLLAGLAEQVDVVLLDLETAGERLTVVLAALKAGAVSGERTRRLRDWMLVVSADAALTEAAARNVMDQVIGRRDALGRELALMGEGRSLSVQFAPTGPLPALLDVTG